MSELAGVSKAPQHMKPGMSHVVNAGETLVIRDENGEEIAVEGREHDRTIAFLRAFDELRMARIANVGGVVRESLEAAVESAYQQLPAHVTSALPTRRTSAVVLL